jgi:hypothetical protein
MQQPNERAALADDRQRAAEARDPAADERDRVDDALDRLGDELDRRDIAALAEESAITSSSTRGPSMRDVALTDALRRPCPPFARPGGRLL